MNSTTSPIMVHRDHWTHEHIALLCGLANAGGGTLVVESTSKVFGPGRRKMRRPFEQIPKLVEKELGIDCSTEPVLDGSVLCLEIIVPAATKPISYEGVCWLFVDDYNTRSTREAVQALIDGELPSEPGDTTLWELQPQPGAKLGGLNTEAFLALATLRSESTGAMTDSLSGMLMRRLSDMGLAGTRKDELTNASVLLLHNEPQKFIPGATVELRLIGVDGRELLGNEVSGALVHQLNETLRLLLEQYLPMGMVASNPVNHEKSFTLNFPPRDALREALLFALAHRDYTQNAPIRVEVDPDRLVIIHPINMNNWDDINFTDDDPFAATASAANPLLTRALQTLGIIGENVPHHDAIAAKCIAAGLPAPVFEQHQDGARTIFSLDAVVKVQASEPVASEAPQDTGAEDESESQAAGNIVGLTGTVAKNAPFSARSIAAANELDLTSTDEYVLRVLHSNGRATAVRIATVLGVSESTVRRAFRKLRNHGIIERVGSDKAGYWRVNI